MIIKFMIYSDVHYSDPHLSFSLEHNKDHLFLRKNLISFIGINIMTKYAWFSPRAKRK